MGSVFTAAICDTIAEAGLPDGKVRERICNWPGIADSTGDAVPLRLTGALHRLVLDGADTNLARVYPPADAGASQLLAAVHRAVLEHEAFIVGYLESPPQTNEIGRSAILWPGLLWLAARYPSSFEILEIGASAGLNQNLDRYLIDYGHFQLGDPASPVRIACQWRGNTAFSEAAGKFTIAARSGCDIAPVSINTEDQRKRLRSYVWADQIERLQRIEAALELARNHPPRVDQAGASDWLAAMLPQAAKAVHRVVMHTVMWQYLPDAERARTEAEIRAAGHRATRQAPLSWLRFEADASAPGGGLYATSWSGGPMDGITRCLGRADFHGRWIDWRG